MTRHPLRKKTFTRYLLWFALPTILASAWVAPALLRAQSLRASVMLMQGISRADIRGNLLSFAKKHQTKRLTESSEPELSKRTWSGYMVISFTRPPQDAELTFLYYDIHQGTRKFVESRSSFLSGSRSEKVFLQPFRLDRPTFRPNRRMELVITMHQQEVANLKFEVLGQEPKRSGVVDFTEDETKSRP
jgi:hypothetical protein